jgi:hypothetical protein
VNDAVAAVVGVPEITPVLVFSVSPAGSDPAVMLHVYGAVPPTAPSMNEYAVPTMPAGSGDVDVIVSFATIMMLRFAVAVLLSASVTFTVKLELPAVVGVPDITPVLEFSDNPAGNVPLLMLHVYGVTPPVAASVVVYATLTIPFGSVVVVIISVDGILIVILSAAVAVFAPDPFTPIKKLLVPAVVGVPEITPVLAAKLNPAGSVPCTTLHVYGLVPLVAASVAEYATPTVPFGKLVVVIRTIVVPYTVKLRLAVAVLLALSVTLNVRLATTAVVGVPEITPVLEFRVNPAGNVPELTLHV